MGLRAASRAQAQAQAQTHLQGAIGDAPNGKARAAQKSGLDLARAPRRLDVGSQALAAPQHRATGARPELSTGSARPHSRAPRGALEKGAPLRPGGNIS